MKHVICILHILMLTTVACATKSKEQSTFGMAVDYVDGRPGTGLCQTAGFSGVTSSLKLDLETTPGPKVWLEMSQNFDDERSYVVRAYAESVDEHLALVPNSREELFERRYDEAFGILGKTDTFEVLFDGKRYKFTAEGLPGKTACPNI